MSVEGDIGALKAEVANLKESQAAMKAEHAKQMQRVLDEQKDVRSYINMGKGAAKVIVIFGGFVGTIAGAVLAFWDRLKGLLI